MSNVRPGKRRRDRHGRGLRGALAPAGVPIAQTPSDTFDAAVLDAVDHLQAHGLQELDGVEFAVEDVPLVPALGAVAQLEDDVLDDGGVPLARAYPHGAGGITAPLIVLYRRPVESRALDGEELTDIVHDIIVDRLAHLLGRDPSEVDPHYED